MVYSSTIPFFRLGLRYEKLFFNTWAIGIISHLNQASLSKSFEHCFIHYLFCLLNKFMQQENELHLLRPRLVPVNRFAFSHFYLIFHAPSQKPKQELKCSSSGFPTNLVMNHGQFHSCPWLEFLLECNEGLSLGNLQVPFQSNILGF